MHYLEIDKCFKIQKIFRSKLGTHKKNFHKKWKALSYAIEIKFLEFCSNMKYLVFGKIFFEAQEKFRFTDQMEVI